jgi:hypothetical protein
MNLEVFVHKSEALSEEYKIGITLSLISISCMLTSWQRTFGIFSNVFSMSCSIYLLNTSKCQSTFTSHRYTTIPSKTLFLVFCTNSSIPCPILKICLMYFAEYVYSLPRHVLFTCIDQNSQSSKAFLFDMKSRLYVATDASPVDSATHNLCSDYLQMLNSFGPLYRYVPSEVADHWF